MEIFTEAYEIRALIASMLVGLTCGVLGCFIFLRNMAMIGDALSHAILPGVVAGFVVAGFSPFAFFTGAVVAGMLTAVLITWLQRNVKTKNDAAIGVVFTAMFAFGVMWLSYITRKQGVHLDMKDFLFGNLLGVGAQDLALSAIIAVLVLFSVIFFYRYFFITTFEPVVARAMGISTGLLHYFLMLLLSFTVVSSLQSVGVILVAAMLIIPASTAFLLTHHLRKMLIISGLLGMSSAALGLAAAIWLNTTPGPAITVAGASFYGLAILFAPERGALSRYYLRNKANHKVALEDLIKLMLKLQETGKLTLESLRQNTAMRTKRLNRYLAALKRLRYAEQSGGTIRLTPEGLQKGYNLVRAHRLWETYLVQTMGFRPGEIHEHAERYEHLLDEALMEEIDEKLGHPVLDPHGSAIPQQLRPDSLPLTELKPQQRAVVTNPQPARDISLQLWELGITPAYAFRLAGWEENAMLLDTGTRVVRVPMQLAQLIKVVPLAD